MNMIRLHGEKIEYLEVALKICRYNDVASPDSVKYFLGGEMEWLVGWLVKWLAGWLTSWLARWLVGRLIGWARLGWTGLGWAGWDGLA